MYDYIIVGQGIAGTLVAHFLLKQGKSLAIIDNQHHQASSMVAAGLINPITGRNFVKSWRVDELIPFAVQTYRALETQFGISIFESKQVAMMFNNIKTQNDWIVRSGSPDVKDYVTTDFNLDFYRRFLNEVDSGVEFQQAGRAKFKGLVLAYKELLKKEQHYIEEVFDYEQLEIKKAHLSYQGIQAKRIIFAEGFQATQNPYFGYLPFGPAKGDILIVRIPDYPAKEKLVKQNVFILHLKDDLYWIGSTYNRDYTSIKPTEKAKNNLTERLKKVLKLPFEVVEHLAAIRPTVMDRRPFIGQHPNFESLYIFNGMGAKGASLAPFWANEFVAFLEDSKALDKEVDIARYVRFHLQ